MGSGSGCSGGVKTPVSGSGWPKAPKVVGNRPKVTEKWPPWGKFTLLEPVFGGFLAFSGAAAAFYLPVR